MSLILWVVLGGIAGWIASMIAGNNKEQGILGNVIVGIIGAFVGGFLVTLIGGDDVTLGAFNLYSLVVAIGGAVVVLWIKKKVF